MAESLIGLYKLECVRRDGPFRTVDDLELATLNWVHWFNEHRLHGSIGLGPTDRVRDPLSPSDQPPATAVAGRTRQSLNRGRFKHLVSKHRFKVPHSP